MSEADTPWRAIFVVGAGRSGTSALMRGVASLGVEIGEDLKSPTRKNPTGFFEDRDLLDVAKRARTELGLRAESVALVDDAEWGRVDLSGLQREALEIARRRFGKAPIWGFKYSQTLRLLPFWDEIFRLGELDVRFVVAARNPLSVARSRAALDAQRGIQEKSDLEWLVNVVPYFRRMAERPFVVVDYDLLMDQPEAQLTRVAERLDIPLDEGAREGVRRYTEEFLTEGLRHTRFDVSDLMKDERVNPLVKDAYRWLRRLAADEVHRDDPVFWEGWGRIESSLSAMAPLLRHVDHLERELARKGFGVGDLFRAFRERLPRVLNPSR